MYKPYLQTRFTNQIYTSHLQTTAHLQRTLTPHIYFFFFFADLINMHYRLNQILIFANIKICT